jgi:DNA repair exonuclease SbcCD ATPase subunit
MKAVSQVGESERDFRIRLQQLGNEQRDIDVSKLRKSYEAKVARLEDRLISAEQAHDRESEQASGSKLDTALSVGTAVLGALLGRKRVSTTNVGRAGTAARRASNMRKQVGDVKRAQEKVAKIEQDIEDLKEQFEDDVAAMHDAYNAQTDELDDVIVRAQSSNIQIGSLRLGWRPAFRESKAS